MYEDYCEVCNQLDVQPVEKDEFLNQYYAKEEMV